MIKLSNYITEKLHLNKNIDAGKKLKVGDKFSTLGFYFNNEWDKNVELRIEPPFEIKSIEDNKITWESPWRPMDITYDNCYVNSHGYYQQDKEDTRSIKNKNRLYDNTILLPIHTYREILDSILKEKVFNPKYAEEGKKHIIDMLLDDYFDNVDEEELKSKELVVYDYTGKYGVGQINRPKELKDIISTHYSEE